MKVINSHNKSPKTEEFIKNVLEETYKRKIVSIKINGQEKYKGIMEYDFSLLKVAVTYEDNQKETIYLKFIKGGKIKESIFCYWSLLYDEYLKEKHLKEENTIKKAIITQLTSNEFTSHLILTLNEKLNYCAEINLVDLAYYKENKIYKERWLEEQELKNGCILFIGKKMY